MAPAPAWAVGVGRAVGVGLARAWAHGHRRLSWLRRRSAPHLAPPHRPAHGRMRRPLSSRASPIPSKAISLSISLSQASVAGLSAPLICESAGLERRVELWVGGSKGGRANSVRATLTPPAPPRASRMESRGLPTRRPTPRHTSSAASMHTRPWYQCSCHHPSHPSCTNIRSSLLHKASHKAHW